MRAQAKGLAGSMPKIDQSAIGALRIPVPSAAAQDEVVSRVTEIEDVHSRLVLEIQIGVRRVQTLRAALLGAAFAGQLT